MNFALDFWSPHSQELIAYLRKSAWDRIVWEAAQKPIDHVRLRQALQWFIDGP